MMDIPEKRSVAKENQAVRRRMPTPYAGVYQNPKTGKRIAPPTGPHVICCGPSGGGKTEGFLVPASTTHPGPLVQGSSKDDSMLLTLERRVGPSYLIDLRQIPDVEYPGVRRVRIDPTTLIETPDDALNMATWLHRVSSLSLGGRITSHSEPYWAHQIIPCLAAVLYAASPSGNGEGIEWVLHCVENPFKRQTAIAPEPLPVPSTKTAELKYELAKAKKTEAEAAASAPGTKVAKAKVAVRAAEQLLEAARKAAFAVSDAGSGDAEQEARQVAAAEDIVNCELQLELAQATLAEALTADKARNTKLIAAKLAVHEAKEDLDAANNAKSAAIAYNAEQKEMAAKVQQELAEREELKAAGQKFYDEEPPSWWDVRKEFHHPSLLPVRLERTATLNERQRDSVALGMTGALFPWLYESVRRPDLDVFDLRSLDDPTATLYILAEPEGGGVGAALPLIQAIMNSWRNKTSLNILEHNLGVAIDELTNTLPLPTLDIFASEARGLGINLMIAVQSMKQIANRYDPVFMEALIAIFPVVLLMYGSAELEFLDQASFWSGLTNRAVETVDQEDGRRSYSHVTEERFKPQELQPTEPYTALLLYRGSSGVKVAFPKWEQFLYAFDNPQSKIIDGLVRI
ncbi:TraM recognition domain-containing protein [Mycobacteroides abscessus]|uniref:TraM recognition domain-containing protein n=1 Tax=Mycobacteroides abscessus TaxID=36809 RepID=UPI0009A5D718|nr:type IV secretory system conjugative DNA transfer family protein [Mycobacteroides abscessus]SKH87011.1 type IV secretory pathway, VirD4 component [Mycobacteroides abscessus subsp. massiliense]SKH91540.1 type IV secretory pathway, VirD4 component [Mycobacteroides abscessus subsp. massiliense]SKI12350.1 type IV secretory pathway, VirD4 component [Mycobacteroides abscessus subsp. massiliense]SKK23263.1 type IV secretory pathway, VirD4 component [Mycobacteroides abscessus subsp. massiliense]SKK